MSLTLVRNIGHGGFGVVDEVFDEKGKHFARKTFSINQGPHFPAHLAENVKKRFVREANIQEAIEHKNIVPIISKNLNTSPPYFLMPLAKSSLQDDIEKDKTLGGNFMNAFLDVIAALEELHSMDIYHRDLKPANVLKFEGTANDKRDFYAIGDFGLMSVSQTNISSLTQTGMRMGSDYYTAPEIVKDLRNASAQSDIYSLGCILHDFVGKEERIPCGEIKEDGDFGGILLNCTRRDPSRRFKSVTAFRDALLSLGDINVKPLTTQGAGIFDILDKEFESITEDEWKSIVFFVEDEYSSDDSIGVLRKLNIDFIEELIKSYPQLGNRLGLMYAKWIREHSFSFEECDGLSIRLQKFVQRCKTEVQAECLMAMFYLGTSHNRYYVEKKFVGLTDKTLDENVAKRLAVELRVDSENACPAIDQIDKTIYNFRMSNLHPIILDTFKEICKK